MAGRKAGALCFQFKIKSSSEYMFQLLLHYSFQYWKSTVKQLYATIHAVLRFDRELL